MVRQPVEPTEPNLSQSGDRTDFFAPLLYLGENPKLWTLAIGLSSAKGMFHVRWNLTMAASVLFILPVIVLFFLAQRVFVEGVTLTGVKG